MIKWGGGPLPFKADVIASIWDERKCIHWVYRIDDKLYHRIRGSRPPYPISDAQPIGTGYYETGSLMIWADGFLNIFWPNKDVEKVMQKYTKAIDVPDPSAGAIIVLDKELQAPRMMERFGYPIKVSPTLIPRYGIEKSLDEALWCERYLNRGTRDGLFNDVRFFSFGVWEDWTFDKLIFPYAYDGDRFDCFNRNPVWIETLDRRIGQCVERGVGVTLSVIDGCSTHNYPHSHWGLHPWNGRKNINGSSSWYEAVWHFYEEEHQDKPGIRITAKIIEDHVRFLVQHLEAKYRPYITWEIANEAHAAEGWHALIRRWMREEGVTDDNRVQVSMDGIEYPPDSGEYPFLEFYQKQMWQYSRYAAHGIQTIDEYSWMKQWMPGNIKFQPSEDGLKPINANQYRDFVRRVLEDGGHGFELNERPWWHNNVFDPNLFDWNRIKEIGKGFRDFVG